MKENDEDQKLPEKATDENILKETDNEENTNNAENEEDTFVYLKSSSIISILIIVIISLVCVLTTSLLIKTALRTNSISHTLAVYLGFTPNRTIDESTLTFWAPENSYDEQPIETTTTIISSSPSTRPPPFPLGLLTHTEKKAQTIFRNIILPSLLLLSIICGILAFYMRVHHHYYPAWGARPKKPEEFVTIELKQPRTTETNVLI